MKNVVLALDLGGTKLSSAIFEANGKIRQKEIVPLAKRTGKQVGALIGKQIEQSIAKAESERLKISAIGISADSCGGGSKYRRGTMKQEMFM